MRETDWAWVSACMGVVEGDVCPVEAYINSGIKIHRQEQPVGEGGGVSR